MRCLLGSPPTLSTIEVLAPIWQRVLQRTSIGVEDNFFDLGGDPSSAVRLFREIANVSGRELPPLTIFQAPTIGSLAALLQQPTKPRFPALMQLKAGAARLPVFITHGLGGSVMEVFHLAKGIDSPHPIFGMQSKGLDGSDEEPLARVEDIAEFHLKAVKKLQPRGPYALIGYSFGGLVMMELAQRIRESGENVALLAMLETYPHRDQLPVRMRLGLYAGQAKRHAAIVRQLPGHKRVAYLTSRSERRAYASWDDAGIASSQPQSGLAGAPALERVRDGEGLAWMRYRPRFYPGKIIFVKAAKSSSLFPHDPGAVWAKLAEKVEIDTVPGDHFGMVTTHHKDLASVLSRHIAAAFPGE
jgi:acetoacetyl-CoA synthetase